MVNRGLRNFWAIAMFVEQSRAMRRAVFMNVQMLVDQKITKIGQDANF